MTPQLLDHPLTDFEHEWTAILGALTRREFLAGSAAVGLSLAVGTGTAWPADAAGSGWTFTDGLGRHVHLAGRPKRIAVLDDFLAADLWAAGLHPVAAPLASGSRDALAVAGAPTATVKQMVPVNGPTGVNVEALAKARPDLIVQPAGNGTLLTFSNQADIAKLTPIVGIDTYTQDIPDIVASVDHLVAALGIPLTDRPGKARYQQAAARLRKALTAKPGLRVLWCSATTTDLLVDIPHRYPYTLACQRLGMDIYTPQAASSVYSKQVSWEVVPELPADLVINLYNNPARSVPTDPAWKLIPAVKAGQVLYLGGGLRLGVYTYADWAPILDQIATAVDQAKPGVGPYSKGHHA